MNGNGTKKITTTEFVGGIVKSIYKLESRIESLEDELSQRNRLINEMSLDLPDKSLERLGLQRPNGQRQVPANAKPAPKKVVKKKVSKKQAKKK